jgi:F-box/WD-40 domain protein MET30
MLPADFFPDKAPSGTINASTSIDVHTMVNDLDDTSITTAGAHPYGPGFASNPSRTLPARYILTSSLDATVKLWDTATGQCLSTWFGHIEGIWGLRGDNLRVVTGGQDGLVKLWDPRTGTCVRTFTGHSGPVSCVGLTNRQMVSGGQDGKARLYQFY